MPASLEENIAAYEAMRGDLERDHLFKWVVFYDKVLVGVFDSLDTAADVAIERFGRGPYLIREVRNFPTQLPVSALIGGSPIAKH